MGQLTKRDIERARQIQLRGRYALDDIIFVLQQFLPRVMLDVEYGLRFPDRPIQDVLPAGMTLQDYQSIMTLYQPKPSQGVRRKNCGKSS